MSIVVKKLPSGWTRIQGPGPCNWVQVPNWPCDEQTIREHAFPEASEGFLRSVVDLARRLQR